MASPNAVFTELAVTTFRKHRSEIKDNLSNNNALIRRIFQRGNYKIEDGGLTIVEPLDYAANSTYQRYSGYDVLNVGASEVLTAAEYAWRQIAINVAASGQELRTNSGGSRIINLVKAKMKNAIRTFKNNFSVDVYSDGTLTNQIGGLQALVADAGAGTIGGIDSSVNTWWKNTVQSAASPIQGGGAIIPSSTTMEYGMMLPLWLSLVRGDDKPDLIVMSNDYFTFYEQSQSSYKRYTSDGNMDFKASGGFDSLKYKTADVIFDGGSGIPASHGYMLNTDYLYIVAHKDADLEVMDEMKPYNQDAAVVPILWMGNMVCSNRKLQGVMKA